MKKPTATFKSIAITTLKTVGHPLTPEEIWEEANERNLLEGFETTGKTPCLSIGALCCRDIAQKEEGSTFFRASKNPTRFFLRGLEYIVDKKLLQQQADQQKSRDRDQNNSFNERDLHPLLVYFVSCNGNFNAHVKTIDHNHSKRQEKGMNKWLHPDMVGVYFPFSDYEDVTRELQRSLSVSSVKLFSFEMKCHLDFGNLRESYFQAVSNSSWANEGYLVALDISTDESFQEELKRLNNSFGIGVIQLDPEYIDESTILFPSRIRSEIDWDTVNRLAEENTDFVDFIKSIMEDCKVGKVKSKYDDVLSDDKIKERVTEKQIKRKNV